MDTRIEVCPACGTDGAIDLTFSLTSAGRPMARACRRPSCQHVFSERPGRPSPGSDAWVDASVTRITARRDLPRIACVGEPILAARLGAAGYAVIECDPDAGSFDDAIEADVWVIARALERSREPGAVLQRMSKRLGATGSLLVDVRQWDPPSRVGPQLCEPRRLDDPARVNFFSRYSLVSLLWRSGLMVTGLEPAPPGGRLAVWARPAAFGPRSDSWAS